MLSPPSARADRLPMRGEDMNANVPEHRADAAEATVHPLVRCRDSRSRNPPGSGVSGGARMESTCGGLRAARKPRTLRTDSAGVSMNSLQRTTASRAA